ncbi:MAG: hypothetical protein RLZZ248_2069 [Bacteroidota bacterium]
MFEIEQVLVSDAIFEEKFHCNLNACKGACCIEGDYGAPLETSELHLLEELYPLIEPYLSSEGKKAIGEHGLFTFYKEDKSYGTPLIEGGACAYVTFKDGIAQCGIEKAYLDKKINFKKPISCHLYPIRITHLKKSGKEAINYDEWSICKDACSLGKEMKLPVYQFLKEAIIRKFGQSFFRALDDVYNSYLKKNENPDK